jgi:hypothetical protein
VARERHHRLLDAAHTASRPASWAARPARRAQQPAADVGQAVVAPDAHDLAARLDPQPGGGQPSLEAAGRGQRVGGVLGLALRGAERGPGLVHGGGLHPLRLGERARRHDAARLADPAEKIVRQRKFLQIAEPQFGVGDAVAGGGQQAGADVQPGHRRSVSIFCSIIRCN